jgi:hypothetical protein
VVGRISIDRDGSVWGARLIGQTGEDGWEPRCAIVRDEDDGDVVLTARKGLSGFSTLSGQGEPLGRALSGAGFAGFNERIKVAARRSKCSLVLGREQQR